MGKEKEGITPYGVAAGIPYGNGEDSLYDMFKSAWLGRQTHRLLSCCQPDQGKALQQIISPGNNFIPTVHTRDVARLVRNVVLEKPERSYLLAFDRGNLTQKELVSTVITELSDLSGDVP